MKRTTIILSLMALCLYSCQVDLPAPDTKSTGADFVITSLATAGENFKVRLAHTESVDENRYEIYDNTEMLWRALMFHDKSYISYPEDSMLMHKYKSRLVSTKSDVKLITPSGEWPMTYNKATFDYECDYKPKPGDRLSVTAKCRHNDDDLASPAQSECYASVTVPDWQPDFEILSATKIYKSGLTRDDLGIEEQTADSVVELKIKIIDRSKHMHCYRIKVQGISYSHLNFRPEPYYEPGIVKWCDAFFSNDPLLYDSAITGTFGPWQAYTTDVFTNTQFDAGEYDMTVQSRFYNHSSLFRRCIKITLQPISTSLANYLSSLYRIRSFKESYFSEPSTLSTNVEGGVGVLGAIGLPVSRYYWFPGEEDPNYPQ